MLDLETIKTYSGRRKIDVLLSYISQNADTSSETIAELVQSAKKVKDTKTYTYAMSMLNQRLAAEKRALQEENKGWIKDTDEENRQCIQKWMHDIQTNTSQLLKASIHVITIAVINRLLILNWGISTIPLVPRKMH